MTKHHTIGKRVQVGVFDAKGGRVGTTQGVVVDTRLRKPVYYGAKRNTLERQYDVLRDLDGTVRSYWASLVDFGIMGEFK